METKDPALTKTPIANGNMNNEHSNNDHSDNDYNNNDHNNNVTSAPPMDAEIVNRQAVNRVATEDYATNRDDLMSRDDRIHESSNEIDANTSVENGTETFDADIIDSEHVNDGDNPARQPDRRDQEGGTPFDEGINEDTVGSEAPQSRDINEMNRYANVNNAQTRTLTPDEED